MPNGLLKSFEEKFGLPSLIQVSDVLKALPDEKKLRLVKQILDSVDKIKGGPDELQMALELVGVIVNADMEHLTAIRDITANLVKLARFLPKEGLKQLPLKELIEEVRKG